MGGGTFVLYLIDCRTATRRFCAVLWRCLKNRLTHAWVAPDRDDYAADWASVDEDRFLQSRAMAATNEVLAEQLPPGRDYWNFHFNNYSVDIVDI